jgi:hypothetical protein
LKQQDVHIILEDDNPIFRKPYKLNEMERTLVQIQIIKFLDTNLVEFFKGEYVSTTIMPTKKNIFGN